MDIISWIKTTLSKYSSNNTHDKNAIYFVKNEDGKTGKIISDEVVYGNGDDANGVVVESPNQPTEGESVWVNPDEDPEEVAVYNRSQVDALHQSIVNSITSLSEAGYLFSGVATSETNPGTPDAKVFYIANGKGTYEKFGGLEVTEDDVVVFYWDSAWHKVATGIASHEKLSELEISTDRQINNIGYTLDKAAMSFDLEAGEHSSKKDVFYIDINAGETFDILLKNITSQNSGAASVFVHYDGDADTTNFGSVNIGTKKTFTTQRKITSIGFYMPSSVASSTGTMGVEISKIGSVKNSIDQKPDNVFLNIGNADEIKAGYSIYFSNGSLTTSSKATTYIFRNNDFKKVIADLSYNTSTMAAVAFYTGNTIDATTYDSTHSVKNFGSRHTYEIDVPDNCKLIAFVNRADYLATPSIEIRLKSLVGVSQRYEPKLEEINKNIGNATDIVSLNDPLNMGRKLNEIKSTRTNENLVLLHFSDIHAQANNLLRIKEFFSHYSQYINDVICTGDLLFNKWSDDFTYWENANVGDFMITIGNHETTTDASTWGNVPMADVNARFIAPYIGNWGVQHQTGKNYYYKDYTTQKIRLIVIDPYYDETAQTTWLESVLNDALTSELSVVIAEHNPFPTYTPLQTSFVSPYDTGVGALGNKIAAYMELVQNFHNNGGNFICWLCGHMHRDAVAKSVTYPNQLMVAVPATKIAESGNDDKRIAGTKSQDCFNVVSINPTHKTITIIRIGSDLDSLLRHKGTLCVNYENKEILWND